MYMQKDVENVNSITVQEIKGKIKLVECSRLELREGTELIIKWLK